MSATLPGSIISLVIGAALLTFSLVTGRQAMEEGGTIYVGAGYVGATMLLAGAVGLIGSALRGFAQKATDQACDAAYEAALADARAATGESEPSQLVVLRFRLRHERRLLGAPRLGTAESWLRLVGGVDRDVEARAELALLRPWLVELQDLADAAMMADFKGEPTAVVVQGTTMTYQELDERAANALAIVDGSLDAAPSPVAAGHWSESAEWR